MTGWVCVYVVRMSNCVGVKAGWIKEYRGIKSTM